MDVHYWPIATFPCAAKIGRFRGIADMAALVDGSTLVANDPKRAFGAALAALCNADPQIANVRSTGCVASQQPRPKKAGQ